MANDDDQDDADRIVRQRYDQEMYFRNLNFRQLRCVMNRHDIRYQAANGNILPQCRRINDTFIRYRAPHVNAVLAHFQQPQLQQHQQNQPPEDDQISDRNGNEVTGCAR